MSCSVCHRYLCYVHALIDSKRLRKPAKRLLWTKIRDFVVDTYDETEISKCVCDWFLPQTTIHIGVLDTGHFGGHLPRTGWDKKINGKNCFEWRLKSYFSNETIDWYQSVINMSFAHHHQWFRFLRNKIYFNM